MSASQNNSSSADQRRGGSWAGWILIGVVILIMGFAVMLSIRQLTDAPAAPDPLATPKPKIGSMLVEPEVDSFDGDSRFDSATASGDETGVEDTGESAEAPAVTVEVETTPTGGETAQPANNTIGGTIIESPTLATEAPPASAPQARELVIVSGIEALLSGVRSVERPMGIALAPTATEIANPSAVQTEVATAAFGRVAARQGMSQTVEPVTAETAVTPESVTTSPAAALDETPSPAATATPVPTDTATAVPTDTPTDTPAPTATPTGTPSSTPTDTPLPTATFTPTATPTPSPTATATSTPTSTYTPVPTVTDTPQPTATPTISIEDLPVQLPPGSIVVSKAASLAMYMDASPSAPIMATYDDGTEFSVMEPVPPFDSYPVLANGVAWLRVRAEDGLVGWIDAAFVIVNK